MVNEEIIKINDWLIDNKLSLNLSKSYFLLFTGNLEENNFVVTLNGTNIARSRFVKYLGIHIDDKLTWDHHVDHVLLKVRQGSGILKQLSYLVPNFVNLIFSVKKSSVLII